MTSSRLAVDSTQDSRYETDSSAIGNRSLLVQRWEKIEGSVDRTPLGVPPAALLQHKDGKNLIKTVHEIDSNIDDRRGYFGDLVDGVIRFGVPLGLRLNTARKPLNGKCDAAEQVRDIQPGEAYNGELRTTAWAIKGDGIVMAHLPASQRMDIKKMAEALGVARSRIKGAAQNSNLHAAGLDFLENGLFNPWAQTGGSLPKPVIHVLDSQLLEMDGLWTTNAGTRELATIMDRGTFQRVQGLTDLSDARYLFAEIATPNIDQI